MDLFDKLETSFKNEFPKSFFRVSKNVSLGDHQPSFSITIALKNQNWPNNIIQNDVMYHVFMVYVGTESTIITNLTSGLSTRPDPGSYLAIKTIPTKIRKRTGSQAQIIKHFDQWVKNLKQLVIQHQNNFYGDANSYQEFIQ